MHCSLIGERAHILSGSCARRGGCSTLGNHLASAPAWPTPGGVLESRYSARARVVCCASTRSFYDILGVSQSATERDIKSAYRKKALKLHPDVNKAPDAQQRFMEAKMAFETLGDPKQRAEYDRKLRMGFGSASSWGSSSGFGSYGSYGGTKRPSSEPENNYSFADLMRDLDKELNSWMKSKGSSQPKSLIEELAMLGEVTQKRVKRSLQELVDFLEDTIGAKEDGTSASKANSTSSTGGGSSSSSRPASSETSSRAAGQRRRSPVEEFDELWSKYVDPIGKNTGSSSSTTSAGAGGSSTNATKQHSSSSTSSSGRAAPSKSSDDDIDAMLAELKKKVKRT